MRLPTGSGLEVSEAERERGLDGWTRQGLLAKGLEPQDEKLASR